MNPPSAPESPPFEFVAADATLEEDGDDAAVELEVFLAVVVLVAVVLFSHRFQLIREVIRLGINRSPLSGLDLLVAILPLRDGVQVVEAQESSEAILEKLVS
jgi:hypothetical protein